MPFGDKASIFTHQGHSLSSHEIDLHGNRLSQAIDKLNQSRTPFLHLWQCGDPRPHEDLGFLLSALMAHQLGSRWYGLIHNVMSQWVSSLIIPPVLLGACPSFHFWLNDEPYLISLGVTWRQSHCPSPQPLFLTEGLLLNSWRLQSFRSVLDSLFSLKTGRRAHAFLDIHRYLRISFQDWSHPFPPNRFLLQYSLW